MASIIPRQVPIKTKKISKKKKKISKKKTTFPLPILPQDVIFFNIFLHLPARFLLLLRSLSRSSLQMINNPHFVRNHAVLSSAHLLFFGFNHYSNLSPTLFGLQINRGPRSRNRITLHENFKLSAPFLNVILASCNGLLLLSCHKARSVLITNLVTKQCRYLPQPLIGHILSSPLNGYSGPIWQCLYGLTFDPSSNRYKVVHLSLDGAGSILCQVLTLGSSNCYWRLVSVLRPSRPGASINVNDRPVSIGQILYWVDGHSSTWHTTTVFDPSENHIMSMDVGREEFRRVKPPPYVKDLCRLFELGGHLALLSFDQVMVDIWVLQDYEREAWVKKHSTINKRLVKYLGFHGFAMNFELSCSLHDGMLIIFKSKNRLFKYDLEDDNFAEVKTHYGYLGPTPRTSTISNPCAHVDSLLWP
ncbi:F-box protein At1g47810-like [Asparagus officinalis]|uniref:F-box protein At1g47810-like n=1 Tax=Asparagus officinalis TaxID=4686 RepID=UPI00098E231A|nr:F-box protein At1g47810-like [Asparagus officinalis]